MYSGSSGHKNGRNSRSVNNARNITRPQVQASNALATLDSPVLHISDLERIFGGDKNGTSSRNNTRPFGPTLENRDDRPERQGPSKKPEKIVSPNTLPQCTESTSVRPARVVLPLSDGTKNTQTQTHNKHPRNKPADTIDLHRKASSDCQLHRGNFNTRQRNQNTINGSTSHLNLPSANPPANKRTARRKRAKENEIQIDRIHLQRPSQSNIQDEVVPKPVVSASTTGINPIPRSTTKQTETTSSQFTSNKTTANTTSSSTSTQSKLASSTRLEPLPTVSLPLPTVPADPSTRHNPRANPQPLGSSSNTPRPTIHPSKTNRFVPVSSTEEHINLWNPLLSRPSPLSPTSSSATPQVSRSPNPPIQPAPIIRGLPRVLKTCLVCLDPSDEFPTRAPTVNCAHTPTICAPCLEEHISHAISRNGLLEIPCPHDTCRQTLEYSDVKAGARKNKCFERYEALLLRQVLQKQPNFVWCKSTKCDGGQLHESGADAPIVTCRTCRAQSCFTHDIPWHTGLTCTQYDQRRKDAARHIREENASQELINRVTKTCPNESCSRKIEKASGCDHMTCRRPAGCGHEFCWICLANYDAIRRQGNHHHNPTCSHYFPLPGASLVNRLNPPNLNPTPNTNVPDRGAASWGCVLM